MEGWLRIKQATKYCNMSERTVYDWFREGLPHSKVKGIVLIKVENLDEFIERFETKENQVDLIVKEVISEF